MEELLNKVNLLIDESNNIPTELKPIVKCICRGYIRESDGKIPIDGIINVCNTTFIKINELDKSFYGEENILGSTETDYDSNCNVIHKMSYTNDSNYIKLITILTHELGHVITESKPCSINNDVYPFTKRTTTFYQNCRYQNDNLIASNYYGFRMADGFLESISSKIFSSQEFRQELKEAGYDLQNYEYKDERLFPSRIYDEYKACFELFDYIMNGALFEFSCISFNSNEELVNYINQYKLNIIFSHLDKSNDYFWLLKPYEGKKWSEKFNEILIKYQEHKENSLNLATICLDIYGKTEKDEHFIELYNTYKETLSKQKTLPLGDEFTENKRR